MSFPLRILPPKNLTKEQTARYNGFVQYDLYLNSPQLTRATVI